MLVWFVWGGEGTVGVGFALGLLRVGVERV